MAIKQVLDSGGNKKRLAQVIFTARSSAEVLSLISAAVVIVAFVVPEGRSIVWEQRRGLQCH